MNPRLRILFLTLVLVLVAAPAQLAQASTTPTTCSGVSQPGLPPAFAYDDTAATLSSGWHLGPLTVPMEGRNVDAWEWMIDCGAVQSVTPGPGSATIAVEGSSIRFTHRAGVIATGAWTPWVDDIVQIDSTAPLNTTAPPTGWVQGPLTVAVTGSDVSPHTEEWFVEPASTPIPGDAAVIPNATGVYKLHTAVTDSVDLTTLRTDTVQIDNTLPIDDTGTTVPVGWQRNPVTIRVRGRDFDSQVARVEWQLDGGAVQSGPAGGVDVPITTHGTHTLSTRIIDVAGNASPLVVHTVELDLNGPLDTTTVPDGWMTTGTDVGVYVTGTDPGGSGVALVEWKLTDTVTGATRSGSVPGPGPVAVTVSGNGVHKLETRLTDGLGHDSGWTVRYVKIDTVTPTDTTNLVTGWVKQASLDVTVEGTDAHSGIEHVEWKLDGTFLSAPGGSKVVSVTGQGEHTLETRVVDFAGHLSTWRSHTIRLDTTLPLNLTPTASSAWRNAPYSVTLTGNDAGSGLAKMRWRIDSGPVLEGTPGTVVAKLETTGDFTLYTWAVDALGNESVPRPERIRIDLVSPSDDTTYPSGPVENRRVITFLAHDADSGVAGIEWKLDSDPAVKTAATATITGAGPHTLMSRVQDIAGNWSAWTTHAITVDLSVDIVAPTDTTVVPSAWQATLPTVYVTADDDIDGKGLAYVEWKLDGHAIQRGAPGSAATVTTDGVHELETRATDKAGNTSAWKSQLLKVDTTVPTDTTVLPTGWSKSRTLTLSGTDATSGVATMRVQDQRRPDDADRGQRRPRHPARRRRRVHDPPSRPRQRRPGLGVDGSHLHGGHGRPAQHDRRGVAWVEDRGDLARARGHRRSLRRRPRRVAGRRCDRRVARGPDGRGHHRRRQPATRDADRRQGRQRVRLALGARERRWHAAGQHDTRAVDDVAQDELHHDRDRSRRHLWRAAHRVQARQRRDRDEPRRDHLHRRLAQAREPCGRCRRQRL